MDERIADDLKFSFGLTQDSQQRFRSALGQFAKTDELLMAQTELMLDRIALEMESNIRREFEPHNKTGATLETLDVNPAPPLAYEITMAGGAPYIEFGTPKHFVGPTDPGGVLHWVEGGMDYYSKGHEVKGIEADDFIGRAEGDLDLQFELSKIALGYRSELTRTGDYGLNVGQYA